MRNAPGHPLRHVVLVGLMGAGKTTVGRRLAARLGWPWHDSDADIEAATGMTVRELRDRDGVDAMHDLEAAQLLQALAEPGQERGLRGGERRRRRNLPGRADEPGRRGRLAPRLARGPGGALSDRRPPAGLRRLPRGVPGARRLRGASRSSGRSTRWSSTSTRSIPTRRSRGSSRRSVASRHDHAECR